MHREHLPTPPKVLSLADCNNSDHLCQAPCKNKGDNDCKLKQLSPPLLRRCWIRSLHNMEMLFQAWLQLLLTILPPSVGDSHILTFLTRLDYESKVHHTAQNAAHSTPLSQVAILALQKLQRFFKSWMHMHRTMVQEAPHRQRNMPPPVSASTASSVSKIHDRALDSPIRLTRPRFHRTIKITARLIPKSRSGALWGVEAGGRRGTSRPASSHCQLTPLKFVILCLLLLWHTQPAQAAPSTSTCGQAAASASSSSSFFALAGLMYIGFLNIQGLQNKLNRLSHLLAKHHIFGFAKTFISAERRKHLTRGYIADFKTYFNRYHTHTKGVALCVRDNV